MAPALPDLLELPPELLLEISDYLGPDAILSLRLTHPSLNSVLPHFRRFKNRSLSKCARYAIERYRCFSDASPTHQRCILCKAVYPLAIFSSSSSPACMPLSFVKGAPRSEVVELPPHVCAWHVSRLAKVIQTEPGGRNEWVSGMKKMCMCNGCIEGWSECDCHCDSCGHQTVRTYTRYLNNRSECRRFLFFRNITAGEGADPQEKAKGRLFVRESCWDENATEQKSTLELPVHYELEAGSVLKS